MLLSILISLSLAGEFAISEQDAAKVFGAAERLAQADGGKLWGMSLKGPMLLIDPATRQVVANQADAEGALAMSGSVFRGQYPANAMFGNTAVDWKGTRWTMLMWPVPGKKQAIARLLMHESFHRIQPLLNWRMKGNEAPHLAEMGARTLLQLEYRALAKALLSSGKEQEGCVRDALAFRHRRQSQYKGAADIENDLELNEGIAEYTGFKLSREKTRALHQTLAERLAKKEGADSYSRSFCYETGPAYALLLDTRSKTWRNELRQSWNLTELASKVFGYLKTSLNDNQYRQLADRYDAQPLEQREAKLDELRQQTIRKYRELFVDGPVIELHIEKPNISFNPNNLFPLGDDGTVYPTMGVSDVWGKLDVKSGGALMKDWKLIRVPLPKDLTGRIIQGDGWTLELAEGWSLVPGTRAKDRTAAKQ